MKPDLQNILQRFQDLQRETLDSGDGMARLEDLCEEVEWLYDPTQAFPAFFQLMERLPDADLGSPGPLVHTMERHIGCYEDLLEASVRRCPTELSLWMVSRLLNAPSADRQRWVTVLRSVENHASALDDIKDEARRFLQRQNAC